jgi:hypothetical protein
VLIAALVAVQAAISARNDFEIRLLRQLVPLCLSGVAWTAAVAVLETARRGAAQRSAASEKEGPARQLEPKPT